MNADAARFLRFAVGLLALVTLGWVLTGQAAKPPQHGTSLVTDWSHRHLIFSQPSTAERARLVGEDPRYWQQQVRRTSRLMLPAEVKVSSGANPGSQPRHWWQWRRHAFHRDWAEDLGSGGSVGASNFPAKFSFNINVASCATDFVIFNTGLASSGTQASVVAYNNLYSGCGGAVPAVYWAYDTGGQVLTSITYSLDGSQVAFVQTKAGVGTLVLLKWKASTTETVGTPMTLLPVDPSLYQACSAPCMTTINLHAGGGNTDDTTSAVFLDYTNDVAWIGGSGGWLHKISPVFTGTPAEVTAGGFPVQLNAGVSALSDPVYDPVSQQVFVGDLGGFLYRVDPSLGSFITSARLDHGPGIVLGPLIDPTVSTLYVFSSSDGTTNCAGLVPCSAVYQLSTSFAAGAAGTEAVVGASSASPSPMYIGTFDTTYQTSANATGNILVCGNSGGPPILYQVPLQTGVMGSAQPLPVLSNSATACSPVIDIQNPNAAGGLTEWIFASVQQQGVSTGCAAGGCVFNFKVTPWLPNTAYGVGQEVLDSNLNIQVVSHGGTSGATVPVWSQTVGGITFDPDNPGAHWLNQGRLSAFTLASWLPGHAYSLGTEILDSNNDVELVTTAGTSGTTHPTWPGPGSAGSSVDDGPDTLEWRDLGASATNALATAGGTSGIIIDNTVSSGTLAGTSQVYFSTLGNQTCATSGGSGGCAVQASQQGLQ